MQIIPNMLKLKRRLQTRMKTQMKKHGNHKRFKAWSDWFQSWQKMTYKNSFQRYKQQTIPKAITRLPD